MNNVFVIHGVDHKVGTTMLSQSIAETISSSYSSKKILLLFLNGRKSTDYIKEEAGSIENIKLRIDNMMIDGTEIESFCLKKRNLFIMAGISKIEDERFYFPENAEYLLSKIEKDFDIIIIDSGNNLDNGLAIGALKYTENRILVITQLETALKRFDEMLPIYTKLNLSFKRYLINKYYENDPYDQDYISKRIQVEDKLIFYINQNNNYRQAEASCRSLLEFKDENYTKDIFKISNWILECMGLERIQNIKRNKKWINFI